MGLFRPYTRDESDATKSDAATKNAAKTAEKAADKTADKAKLAKPSSPAHNASDESHKSGKGAATPTRRQAEAARMERLHPTLTKKEIRAREREAAARDRERSFSLMEEQPARVLLRNYVDARWTFTEFVWPLLLILLAVGMAGSRFPAILPYSSILAWVVMLGVVVDVVICWNGYKKVLRTRYPHADKRGLVTYMISRMISPRRWRRPAPVINRGDKY